MIFVVQKAIKRQALVDFLAAYSVPETLKLHEDILEEVIKANNLRRQSMTNVL